MYSNYHQIGEDKNKEHAVEQQLNDVLIKFFLR